MISNLYPPYYNGGYELACRNYSEGLEKRNNQVVILTSQYGVNKPVIDGNIHRLLKLNPLGALNYRPLRVNPFRIRIRYKQLKWSLFTRQNYDITLKVIKSVNPDIICAWNMEEIGVMPLLASNKMGIPTVVYVQDYWLSSLQDTLLLEPGMLKRRFHLVMEGLSDFNQLGLKHLIMVSKSLQRHYVEKGFAEDIMSVIENGIPEKLIVDAAKKNPASGDDGVIKLLYVGRLVQEKGIQIAVRAMDILVNKFNIHNISLDIVGDGLLKNVTPIKELTTALNLDHHVHFFGRMDYDKVIEEYDRHFAVLVPSLWDEPFGLTILEAMARGIPVIASDRGNSPDMIDNGQTGFIVPAENPEAYALVIKKLMEDQGLYQKIWAHALQEVQNRYRFNLVLDKIIKTFSAILRP